MTARRTPSATDVVTSVFETLRLRSLVSFVAELRAGDAVAVPGERGIVRFHLVRRGVCTVEVPGATPATLARGDLILVPQGGAQVLRAGTTDGIGGRAGDATPLDALLAAGAVVDGVLRCGDGPAATSLLCGYCGFEPGVEHPLLGALPATIVLREGGAGVDPWMLAALRLLALESDRAGVGPNVGTGAILTRAIEIVFVQAVRAMVAAVGDRDGVPSGSQAAAPISTRSFLGALGERHLARALAALHGDPARSWTLDALAREAGMSRSSFALSFTARVGRPAMTYLTQWRILLARDLLRRTSLSVDEIAARVGYASPAAFSRRFKSSCGIGPGEFRRGSR